MRNAGRLKLGYYPLPIDEAWNIRSLLVSPAPYAAIDPCVGDGIFREQNAANGRCPRSVAKCREQGLSLIHI